MVLVLRKHPRTRRICTETLSLSSYIDYNLDNSSPT